MQQNNEILIDYLDKQLSSDELAHVAKSARENSSVAGELEFLKLAIETVRQDAIQSKVSAVRQSFTQQVFLQLINRKPCLSCS